MVDANSAYDLKEAKSLGRKLENEEVVWFEEPIPPHKNEDYAKLANELGMHIAGGESLFSRFDFQPFIDRGGFDVVQPDIARCGGLTEFLRIAELSEKRNLKIAPHVGLSGPGARAAALNASAALDDETFSTYEYMYKQDNPLATEIVSKEIEVFSDGYMKLPEGPGLGLEIDKKALESFDVRKKGE